MKKLAIAAAISLGGCALTPAQVLDQGTRITRSSHRPVAVAAGCLARAAESLEYGLGARFPASVRAGPVEGMQEVVLHGGVENGPLLIVRIEPVGAGSRYTIWTNTQAIVLRAGSGGERLASAGC
jgi:hypothetical protein